MRPLLVLLLASSIALAGCSTAPLATATAIPDRPSETVTRVDHPAEGTLVLTSAPRAPQPAPGLATDCLIVADDEFEMQTISKGEVTLEWDPESALVGDLAVSVFSDKEASATGPSPLTLAWTAAAGGPSAFPFLVRATLADGAVALQQEVRVTVTADTAAAFEAFAFDCGAVGASATA